jgi:hypothetical protein
LLERAAISPAHVLADAGYDASENFRYVYEEMGAVPVIRINKRRGQPSSDKPSHHSKTLLHARDIRHRFGYVPSDSDTAEIYRRRQGVERLIGRAKDFRRLNRLTLRGIEKATVHCLVSMLTLLAHALAALLLDEPDRVRTCV